jgi:predicted DNA-binding ribbon-helix-helix protein
MSRPGSLVLKHSVVIGGHNTSVSLEYEFWKGLREIADRRGQPLAHLIAGIDAKREFANLSSVLRVFVLEFYREQYSSGKLVDHASEHARPVD